VSRYVRNILICIIALTIIGGLICAGYYFTITTERIKFWTESFLSAAVLAAIIVQAYVYFRQRDVMERQWQAMQDALAQAKEQTRIAGDSLVIGTRSYVGLHSIDLNKDSKTIFIKIENIGRVPSDSINVFVDMLTNMPKERVTENETVRPWCRVEHRSNFGGMQLFPGTLQFIIPIRLRALSDEEIDLIVQGPGSLIIRGTIDYTDGFGPQQTRFFFWYYAGDGDGTWVGDAPERWAEIFDGMGKQKET